MMSPEHVRYTLVDTEDQRNELVAKLIGLPEFALVAVTDEAENFDFTLTRGLCYRSREAWYMPVTKGVEPQRRWPGAERFRIRKAGHNLKYTVLALRKHDIDLGGVLFDSLLAHITSSNQRRHMTLA